jgi:hypothetical protein
LIPNGQVSARLTDIYAVVWVGGMADDSLVFFVKSLHRPPRERHPALQFAGVVGQFGVLPGGARLAVLAGLDGVPGGRPEVGVPGGVPGGLESAVRDGGEREIGHRIAAWFVQQHHVLTVGDPAAAEPDPHAAAQWLGEQHPVGERTRDEEPADGSGCEWSLLPGQAHVSVPFGSCSRAVFVRSGARRRRCAVSGRDRSKANAARWCSMAVCGNRMKGRRHYQRSRA